ncbi:MAG: hypothetical protein AB7P02_28230 [Alphaproteobacteria bacterium]
MILFVATAAHRYTMACLADETFGVPLPQCRVTSYERLFAAKTIPTATWIFTDIDRLLPWELPVAAEIHRWLRDQGMRCLNDPARVMGRFQLLRRLHDDGHNPFNVYRADERPRPRRFPVFLRNEDDHTAPRPALVPDQRALDAALAMLAAAGTSPKGMLVVEFVHAPLAPGLWRKFGTFSVGEGVSVDHAVIEDQWAVKQGTVGTATPEMYAEELAAVTENAFAPALLPVFRTAAIEWGRADHTTVAGREVVWEINTNPDIRPLAAQASPLRDRSLLLARRRMALLLDAVDTPPGPPVAFEAGPRLRRLREAIRHHGPDVLPRP